MTRINVDIPVKNLTDEHLLAEHREIKRVGNRFSTRAKLNKFDDIPPVLNWDLGMSYFFL